MNKIGLGLSATLIVIAVGFFGVSYSDFSARSNCTASFKSSAELKSLIVSEMKARPATLRLLELREDGADLRIDVDRETTRQPLPEDEVDHPMDRATTFLYANVNNYNYRFAIDQCGEVVHITNLTGFQGLLEDGS